MATLHRVMLVEDCPGEALLVQQRLRAAGLDSTVLHVQEPEDALALLKGDGFYADREKHPLPHFLLLDLGLPRIDGFEILQWVRSRPELADVIVIVVTGDLNPKRIEFAYQLGASSFLAKDGTEEEYRHFVQFMKSYTQSMSRIRGE